MAKTLRVRTKNGWITKPIENLPSNRLSAVEIDDNFLALEEQIEAIDFNESTRDELLAARDEAVEAKTEIRNRYYGPLASDPATRPDGTAMQEGDEYHNTVTGERMVYDGGTWGSVLGKLKDDLSYSGSVDPGASLVGIYQQNAAPSLNLQKWVDGNQIIAGSVSNGIFSNLVDALAEADAKNKNLHIDGVWEIDSPLTLRTGRYIVGSGRAGTAIKASASFSGSALIKTLNFDTLAGTNRWFVSEGVQHSMGLVGIRLDCAFKNIWGAQFYAKGFRLQDVLIMDAGASVADMVGAGGFYSEAGATTGQPEWGDLPETYIDLITRDCLGISWDMRGPHDANCPRYISRARNGGHQGSTALRVKRDTGNNYAGLMDMTFAHVYGHEIGIDVDNVSLKAGHIIAESHRQSAVRIQADECLLGMVEVFGSGRDALNAYDVEIIGSNNQIGLLRDTVQNGNQLGGVRVNGNRNRVGLNVDVGNFGLIGLDINGNGNEIEGIVRNASAVGGIGVRTGSSAVLNNNYLQIHTANCATHWNNISVGSGNYYKFRMEGATGQVPHSGVRPNRGGQENVDVNGSGFGASLKRTKEYIIADKVVALDSTAVQTIAIPHNQPWQPYLEHCSAVLQQDSPVTDFVVDYIRIETTTTSTLTVRVKLGTASATVGAKADLAVKIDY